MLRQLQWTCPTIIADDLQVRQVRWYVSVNEDLYIICPTLCYSNETDDNPWYKSALCLHLATEPSESGNDVPVQYSSQPTFCKWDGICIRISSFSSSSHTCLNCSHTRGSQLGYHPCSSEPRCLFHSGTLSQNFESCHILACIWNTTDGVMHNV